MALLPFNICPTHRGVAWAAIGAQCRVHTSADVEEHPGHHLDCESTSILKLRAVIKTEPQTQVDTTDCLIVTGIYLFLVRKHHEEDPSLS